MIKRFLVALSLTMPFFAVAGEPEQKADALLQKARQAAGGEAWRAMRTEHIYLTEQNGGGQPRAVEYRIDLPTGRFVQQRTSPRRWSSGWDGTHAWGLESGNFYVDDVTRETLGDIYRKCLGYWFDRCGPARKHILELRQYQGAAYWVVRIEPDGAVPFDYWINEKSNRIERLQTYDAQGDLLATVDYSDFRRVGKVTLPFAERRVGATEDEVIEVKLDHVVWNEPMGKEGFSGTQGSAIEGFSQTLDDVQLPFHWNDNHLDIDAEVDGYGPFRFMLDTGSGKSWLSPEVAERLKLKIEKRVSVTSFVSNYNVVGEVPVDVVKVAELSMRDQTFLVGALPQKDGFRYDGVLGGDWLRHCVLEIDYAAGKVIFHDPSHFSYEGSARPIPMIFPKGIPRIDAMLDGSIGSFEIDTGDWATVSIASRFAQKIGLINSGNVQETPRYSVGLDGKFALHERQGKALRVGEETILQPVIWVTDAQSGGMLGDASLDGNLGNGILKQFRLILDFPRHTAYFERQN